MGVLDIAGSESFAFNSLEQLFINLSNETLQQFFNDYVFKSELADYEKEGVTIDKIDFEDNADILALIKDPKESILAVLDNELAVPKATDATFVGKLNKTFGDKKTGHKRFVAEKMGVDFIDE